MKYLKYFESIDYLQSLCDDYLTYLKDNNIRVRVVNANTGVDEYAILLMGRFRLYNIKDDIYQFIKILRVNGYKPYIVPRVTFLNGNRIETKKISLGELLSRNDGFLSYNSQIEYIEVRIFIKKI